MIGLLLLVTLADISANAVADRANVRLSDSVRVTLTIEGVAPLAVTVPEQWLAADSSANWRARPLGDATVERLANDRERWTLTLRLDPYATGDPLPFTLNAASVRAGNDPTPHPVAWPVVTIRVTSDLSSTSGGDARPITGIEAVPEAPADRRAVWWVGAAVAVALICLAGYWGRSKHVGPAESPGDWVGIRIAELNRMTDPKATAAAVAETLRGFVTRKYGLPLHCRTTAEIEAVVTSATGLSESIDRNGIVGLLAECDRIQFDPNSPSDIPSLKSRAIEWLLAVR